MRKASAVLPSARRRHVEQRRQGLREATVVREIAPVAREIGEIAGVELHGTLESVGGQRQAAGLVGGASLRGLRLGRARQRLDGEVERGLGRPRVPSAQAAACRGGAARLRRRASPPATPAAPRAQRPGFPRAAEARALPRAVPPTRDRGARLRRRRGGLLELTATLEDAAERQPHERVLRLQETRLLDRGDRLARLVGRVLGERRQAQRGLGLAGLCVQLDGGAGGLLRLGGLPLRGQRQREAGRRSTHRGPQLERPAVRRLGRLTQPLREVRVTARQVGLGRVGRGRGRGRGDPARLGITAARESACQRRLALGAGLGLDGLSREGERVPGRPYPEHVGRPRREHARTHARRSGRHTPAGLLEGGRRLGQPPDPHQHPRQRELGFGVGRSLRCRLLQDLDGLIFLALDELRLGLGQGLVESLVGLEPSGSGPGRARAPAASGSQHLPPWRVPLANSRKQPAEMALRREAAILSTPGAPRNGRDLRRSCCARPCALTLRDVVRCGR